MVASPAALRALRHNRSFRVPNVLTGLAAFVSALVRPHRAALVNLLHMPLAVLGVGCIDFAAFHLGNGWGWLATGISLIVIESRIADEP